MNLLDSLSLDGDAKAFLENTMYKVMIDKFNESLQENVDELSVLGKALNDGAGAQECFSYISATLKLVAKIDLLLPSFIANLPPDFSKPMKESMAEHYGKVCESVLSQGRTVLRALYDDVVLKSPPENVEKILDIMSDLVDKVEQATLKSYPKFTRDIGYLAFSQQYIFERSASKGGSVPKPRI